MVGVSYCCLVIWRSPFWFRLAAPCGDGMTDCNLTPLSVPVIKKKKKSGIMYGKVLVGGWVGWLVGEGRNKSTQGCFVILACEG